MSFKENILKKMEIEQLARKVMSSPAPADMPQKINRQAMLDLLKMGNYKHQRERDLDLYFLEDVKDQQVILVLDNELKIYKTTVADVAMRKSPIIKEMVSIRNAIKILSDKDVVVSRKNETVLKIQNALLSELDLSFTDMEIENLVKDGMDALKNNYIDGVIETLYIFAQILNFEPAPKPFRLDHFRIWGVVDKHQTGAIVFGPVVLYNLMNNQLKGIQKTLNSLDKNAVRHYKQAAIGQISADLEGEKVFQALQKAVLKIKAG
ncbi:MAG: hypothetical protein GY874_11660 [Desulfobacteraceae bacterium]|nr:hypothetical protein [Desulfobacteraceae bacterium]